jgi:uncharacterized protein (DUF1684 family)
MRSFRSSAAGLFLAILVAAAGALLAQGPYAAAIEAWRRDQNAALTAEDGWLTVVGLFWLKAGPNAAGTDPGSDIVLPAGTAPPHIGVFRLESGQATFETEPGVSVLVNGRQTATARLRPDVDRVVVGDLTMFVIKRGDRYAIRLRNRNSEARRSFAGRVWYPVRPAFRVAARFVPYNPPRQIAIVNVIGDATAMQSPGYVEFTLSGRTCRLDPVTEPGATELFFIFKDQTSGAETYPAGRFLYAALPKNGVVDLDFNRAVSPPCAFTAFATCPLPPKQNQLPVRIEAGERYPGHR